ncbi:MAG: hypothetical protein ACQEWG_06205 [Bacteroidota bacterium]
MKKLLLLFFITLMLACSSEVNDAPESNQDPIIGTWKVINMTEYASNSNPIVTTMEECYQRGRTTLYADGTSEGIDYRFNENGECVEQVYLNHTTLSSTWQKISANKYRFTEEFISNGNTMVQSITPESIIFPNSSTMEIMQMGTNRPSNEPINVEYYVHSYQRVN